MTEPTPEPGATTTPVPVAQRPGGRTARTAERVFGAVLELLDERGVDGFQYEEVAQRAGVGRATIYRRWPERELLVGEALERFAELSISLDDSGNLRDDLIDFVCSFAAASSTPGGRAILQITRHPGKVTKMREVGLHLLNARLPDLQARLDAAQAVGQIPYVDAAFLNLMLIGPVQAFIVRESRPFVRDDARRIVTVVLAGLSALGEPDR